MQGFYVLGKIKNLERPVLFKRVLNLLVVSTLQYWRSNNYTNTGGGYNRPRQILAYISVTINIDVVIGFDKNMVEESNGRIFNSQMKIRLSKVF